MCVYCMYSMCICHYLVTICMYVHVLYVCACICQDAFPPNMPVRFPGRKTFPKWSGPSHDKLIFAGWPMYVCVCIECMCMYPSVSAGQWGRIHQEYAWARRWATWRRVCTGIFMMGGQCDRRGEPGSGSPLYYINTWAMVWPSDYPAVALWKIKQNFKTNGPLSFALHWVCNSSCSMYPNCTHTTTGEQWQSPDTYKYMWIHAHTTCTPDHVFGCIKYRHTYIIHAYTCKYMHIHTHSNWLILYVFLYVFW